MQSDQANVGRQDDCFPFVVSVGKYFLLLANRPEAPFCCWLGGFRKRREASRPVIGNSPNDRLNRLYPALIVSFSTNQQLLSGLYTKFWFVEGVPFGAL